MLNDYFDKSIDRISGKENILSTLNNRQQKLAPLIVLAIGSITFLPFYKYQTATISLVLSYISAIAYSAPPFRLKEKDVWGIICASLGQRVFPLLIIYSFFEHFKLDTILFIGLSFLIGLRWILIHQLLDRDRDLKTNVRTFVACTSKEKAHGLILFLFALESMSAVAFLGTITYNVPITLPLMVAYLVYELYLYPFWKKLGLKRMLCSYDFAPLADFYFFWLPLCMSIMLACLISPLFLVVTALEILWKTRYLKFDIGLVRKRRKHI